jgi:small-conductance mechanosensitive channel
VAERHGLVQKTPTPQVLFTGFGESTLTFELRVWLDVSKVNAAQVCSDIRLMIAVAFADYGIVIAFPQRDLHLHAALLISAVVVAADRQATITPLSPAEAAEKPAVIP